ncbi:C-C chemokine receptor type 10 [Polymixia lowei]
MDATSYIDNEDYNWTTNFDFDEWCEPEQQMTIKVFQSCVFCLIFLLGAGGNSLVIATYALYRRSCLRSMTDVFLIQLAVADLLLILTLPLQGVDTHRGWIFSTPLCKATRAFFAINTYSGLLLLACISVDRYIVVAWAQEVLRLRGQMLTAGKLASVGVWLVASLLSVPEVVFSGVSGSGEDASCVMQISGKFKMVTSVALIIIFCLSFLVMVICYSLIGVALWEGHGHGRGKGWQRQRTLKLMVALVLIFLTFQLPYTIVLSQKIAGEFCNPLLEYITSTLAYTRCCLNPILYALVGVRFRNDVMRLIYGANCLCRFRLGPRPESNKSTSPSSQLVTTLSAFSR